MALTPIKEPDNLPAFWNIIDEEDKKQYLSLQCFIKMGFTEGSTKKRKNFSFNEMLDLVHKFAVRGNSGDTARSIVCGIIWLPNCIAVHTHQLGVLISRCKSSINGSFQTLGYKEPFTRRKGMQIVEDVLKFYVTDSNELRKWSVRSMNEDNNNDSTNLSLKTENLVQMDNNSLNNENKTNDIIQNKLVTQTDIQNSQQKLYWVSISPKNSMSKLKSETFQFLKENIAFDHDLELINQKIKADQIQNTNFVLNEVFFV